MAKHPDLRHSLLHRSWEIETLGEHRDLALDRTQRFLLGHRAGLLLCDPLRQEFSTESWTAERYVGEGGRFYFLRG